MPRRQNTLFLLVHMHSTDKFVSYNIDTDYFSAKCKKYIEKIQF